MAEFREDAVKLDQLLLDPNNYRFQDIEGFEMAVEERFHEVGVQDRAYRRHRDESNLRLLKGSVIRNGFLPVERIVVRPYAYSEEKYLVLEGNRRAAALRWIGEDDAAGDPAPNLPSLISRIFSGYGPNWGGLQTRWV